MLGSFYQVIFVLRSWRGLLLIHASSFNRQYFLEAENGPHFNAPLLARQQIYYNSKLGIPFSFLSFNDMLLQ